MKTSILATIETVQNLKEVKSVSHIDSRLFTFYVVTFFSGNQSVYRVKN